MNLMASKNANKAFISNGFTNWQDAGTKNRGINKHFRSETHRETHEQLLIIPNACGDISVQLSTTFNEPSSVNLQNLLKIFECKTFSETSLPLRCRGSAEDSNFTQLYILWEEDNKGF